MQKTLKIALIGVLTILTAPSPLFALTSQQRAFLSATKGIQQSYTVISAKNQENNAVTRQEAEEIILSVLGQIDGLVGDNAEFSFGSTLPIAGSTYTLAGSGITGSATSITLTSLTIPQTGQKIVDADLSETFYGTLEPGSRTKQEIVSCTTVVQNGNGTATLSGCTRGLSPISPYTSSSTLQFAHAGGSQFIFSDPPQLFNLYTAKDNLETITNTWTFTSSTGPFVRLYFGNNKTYGFWHNTTTGQIGYTSSTSDFVFNANGTTFSTVLPLQLTGGELKLATSTYDLELRDNLLGLTTSTVAGGTASGSALDDLWNSRFNATTTHPGSFTFGGNVTSTGHIAATDIFIDGVSVDDSLPKYFGNGSDGDVIISSNTSLSKDMYYESLTINNGVTLTTNGYRIYVKDTLTNNGTIEHNGGNGGAGSLQGVGGTAGSAAAGGTLAAGKAGKVGSGNSGGSGVNGVDGEDANPSLGSNGAAGGNSGAGSVGSSATGGTAGTATGENLGALFESSIDALTAGSEIEAQLLAVVKGSSSGENLSPSAGSGSGAGGGGNASSENWGSGGGSGASGGIILIVANNLINNGIIQANGGNGGAGGNASTNGGAGGGGAGGSGGVVILVYKSITIGTVQVAGGTGGSGGTGGLNNGQVGSNGGVGKIYRWKID